MSVEELESECPAQCGCVDFVPSKSGKTCVKYQDGECWSEAWEDEEEEFDDVVQYESVQRPFQIRSLR